MVCGVADTGSCWVVEAGWLLMNDDIVTRLRDKASQIRCVVGVNTSVIIPMLELEAADEIERLRKQIRQLEAERDQWQTMAVRNG